MPCDLHPSFSTVFQSYQDDGRMIITGCLPTDLAFPGSIPASRRNLPNRKRSSIAHSLSLLPAQRPDMTEILFKMT